MRIGQNIGGQNIGTKNVFSSNIYNMLNAVLHISKQGFFFFFFFLREDSKAVSYFKCVFGCRLKYKLFHYSAYFCYYLWVSLHFLILFMCPTVLF